MTRSGCVSSTEKVTEVSDHSPGQQTAAFECRSDAVAFEIAGVLDVHGLAAQTSDKRHRETVLRGETSVACISDTAS
jgi:hypothetical protein